MKGIVIILFCLFTTMVTYSQDVPSNYYEPYKMIIEKQTLSYGYALYNFTPVLFSRYKMDNNTDSIGGEVKYREKFLYGWSDKSIELYQFWAFKKTKGFEFSFVRTLKNYNFYDSLSINGEIPDKKFKKAETSFEVGWQGSKQIQGPLLGIAISINKSYFYYLDKNDNPINKQTISLGPYMGFKFKLAMVTVNKIKARFGFQEYFYFKYCANGQLVDNNNIAVNSTPIKYINMGGGLRFYRMSKSIRTIGACYTYFDARADFQNFNNEITHTSRLYFSIPLYVGIGLSW